MTLQNFSLFNDCAASEMDRFLEDIFPAALAYAADSSWNKDTAGKNPEIPASPVIDVIEREDEVIVRAEMPGVAKEAADVTFADGILSLKGTVDVPEADKSGRYLRAERSARTYERSLRIPVKIDAAKISAALKDGLLTVTLHKAEELKPRKIQVNLS